MVAVLLDADKILFLCFLSDATIRPARQNDRVATLNHSPNITFNLFVYCKNWNRVNAFFYQSDWVSWHQSRQMEFGSIEFRAAKRKFLNWIWLRKETNCANWQKSFDEFHVECYKNEVTSLNLNVIKSWNWN